MKTVIGLYDSLTEAQQVVQALVDAGFPRGDISLIASDASGEYGKYLENRERIDTGESTDGAAAGAGIGAAVGGLGGLLVGLGLLAVPGVGPLLAAGPLVTALVGAGVGAAAGGLIGALVDAGVPEEDAQYYVEGVRRGGTLVSVQTADEMADEAARIMNRFNAVDVEERASTWRESGWTGYQSDIGTTSAAGMASTTGIRNRDMGRSGLSAHETSRSGISSEEGEVRVPIVEEELQVGKREVQRGGVRVHARTIEQPVEEQVHLRREHVEVERRPVDRPVTDADLETFQEGTIEVTATSEEPVVRKQARVVEEVVVHKDVEHETETVRDTVRRTDVDVEQTDTTGVASTMGTMGGTMARGFERYEDNFRSHYNSTFANTGLTYDRYAPAYRYGYEWANNEQYRGREWNDIKRDLRREWEQRYPDNAWEDFQAAIRRGWDTVRGRR